MSDDRDDDPFGRGDEPPPRHDWLPPSGPSQPAPPPSAPEGPGGWQAPSGPAAPGWGAPPPTGAQGSYHQSAWTGQPQYVQPQGGGGNGKATASLVLGICGLVVCPLICSILALVFGYQARREIDRTGVGSGSRGSATAGIVLGWIGTVLSVLGIILIVVLAATGNLDDEYTYDEGDYFSVVRLFATTIGKVVLA